MYIYMYVYTYVLWLDLNMTGFDKSHTMNALIFKPGAGQCTLGFLKLLLCGCRYVRILCVYASVAINNL